MSEHERALNRLAPKYGAPSPVICPACRQRVKSADERIAALEARLGEISAVLRHITEQCVYHSNALLSPKDAE